MTTQFSDLNLHPRLMQALEERGYEQPTAIQAQMIPVMLTGVDVIGQAQTGTGKTAAFALPILQTLLPGQTLPQALILSPTRELAIQVAEALQAYGRHLGARVLPVYGGTSYERQIRSLKRGVDVVVGTPGRLLDLLRRKSLDLSAVRTLVLDEADEMLSMGFLGDIETLLQATPPDRQVALFSATMPAPIRRLAKKYQNDPQAVAIKRQHLTVAAIEQRYYIVNQRDKLNALVRLFETEQVTRALIFVRTRAGTARLANELAARGFPAEVLNGDLSQGARERVMARFRNDEIKVLVATDVAARGLDIDDISHVFNHDLPDDPEVFVHRVGRTGRAGKNGIAISLITPREQWMIGRIEKYTRQPQTRADLPGKAEVEAARKRRTLERVEVWLRRGRYQREMEMVTELVAAGHDPLDVAAAALRLARASEKKSAVESISAPRGNHARRPRDRGRGSKHPRQRSASRKSHESGMVRLSLDKGRAHGLRPADVVGILAHHADIPGKVIGAIRIQDQHAFVDVPEQFVEQVLSRNGEYRLRSKEILHVERA
ncbi:MAG: DEAD/DEAH box helicase [Anaerolineae bacterium]|nr:MAG: DEAD/DEAH box helicase [Anaerolineae bacterium]